MKFILVAALLSMVPICYCAMTGLEQAKQCIDKWTKLKPKGKTPTEKRCSHVRFATNCFEQHTETPNEMIEDMRLLNEQEIRFQHKYNACDPEIDHSTLTKLIEQSDKLKPEPCALDAYKKCNKKYYEVFFNKILCADFSLLISCLKEESENTCQAEILKRLADIFEATGRDTIHRVKENIPEECDLRQS